ncbi:sulfotransferase [Aestuariibius sp. HNIBRBA575]|uniref:sulfotransferase family protein n=1 Tax=Aestuariibius sp. HNIBRBA575 TaxID=3233343 RepID=UPI0034A2DB61
MTDTLLSSDLLTRPDTDNAPVIVVGLPRSGSSFLSHVLSQLPDLYVFDDLYLQDKAKEIGATGPLGEGQLDKLLFFLGWQIRARLRFGSYAIPNMSKDEVDPMNAALKQAIGAQPIDWMDLQKEWMIRLAQRAGKSRWGYKLPKAFRNLDNLRRKYPDARVVFLLRQPHDVLKSFKFMPVDSQDGHPDRYHPVFYALYWRMAARAAQREMQLHPDRTCLITFDALTRDTQQTAETLSSFLSLGSVGAVTKPPRPNSSHGNAPQSEPARVLTGLEHALVSGLCNRQIDALGFERRRKSIALSDVADLARSTWRSLRFRLQERRKARLARKTPT